MGCFGVGDIMAILRGMKSTTLATSPPSAMSTHNTPAPLALVSYSAALGLRCLRPRACFSVRPGAMPVHLVVGCRRMNLKHTITPAQLMRRGRILTHMQHLTRVRGVNPMGLTLGGVQQPKPQAQVAHIPTL